MLVCLWMTSTANYAIFFPFQIKHKNHTQNFFLCTFWAVLWKKTFNSGCTIEFCFELHPTYHLLPGERASIVFLEFSFPRKYGFSVLKRNMVIILGATVHCHLNPLPPVFSDFCCNLALPN